MLYRKKKSVRQLLDTVAIRVGSIRIEITAGAPLSRTAKTVAYPRHRASNGRLASMRPIETQPTASESEFNVILAAYGDKKIEVIKEVRSLTGLGLKDACDLVNSAPTCIKQGVGMEEAEKIEAVLQGVGAEVLISASHSGNGQFRPAYASQLHTGESGYGA
jgi:ribosomal protein L7/L12